MGLLLFSGCTTKIIPPKTLAQPTTVCVVDHGRHASLVLPEGSHAVEYEYGDWTWFALGKTGSPQLMAALFTPTQGTLGRRRLPYPPEPSILKAEKQAQAILSFYVSSHRAEAVRKELENRYQQNIHTEIYNVEYEMTFVKDPEDYTGFHNSNHELAQWLRQLGCEVKGGATFARFRLGKPTDPELPKD